MFAIVDIAGQQFKVEKGKTIYVHRLQGDEGSQVNLGNVLLFSDDKNKVKVGNLDKASVKATIVKHLKGDKVIVFKKKRRKGYKVKNGHRQYLTQIKVDDILS